MNRCQLEMNNIKAYLREQKKEIDVLLKHLIDEKLKFNSDKLRRACEYALLSEGKRLRPIIMNEVFKMFCTSDEDNIKNFMCAIEMVHNFSLIHDDLPAIDNDDIRHSKPSTHIVFGEDVAILAGDILFGSAISLVLEEPKDYKAAQLLIRCSNDMIDGETLDVVGNLDIREITKLMYELKTSRLIEACFCIGAILAGCEDETIKDMETVGKCLGMAYQLRDDILDVIGDEKVIGKNVGSDEINDKNTLLRIYGVEKTKELIYEYSDKANEILKKYLPRSERLMQLVDFLTSREK